MQRSRDLTVHAGQLSNLWYLILTVGRPQENSAATVRDWLRDLLDDGTGDRMPIYAGVGSAADDRGGLPRSRKEAERALAVARLAPAPGAPLAFEDCWARAALIRVLDPTVVADLETVTPCGVCASRTRPTARTTSPRCTPGWSTRATSAPPRSGCTSTRTPCATG